MKRGDMVRLGRGNLEFYTVDAENRTHLGGMLFDSEFLTLVEHGVGMSRVLSPTYGIVHVLTAWIESIS